MSLVVIYGLLAVVLKLGFNLDIFIPCLWKTTCHVECPGCGLTTALLALLRLDLSAAFDANPFIFIILPAIIAYIYIDVSKFMKGR